MGSTVQGFFCINPRIPLRVDFTRKSSKNPRVLSVSCSTKGEGHSIQTASVFEKVRSLDLEFKSLPEPLDRVKRLLHYATLLTPLDESARVQENRVSGCTAEVWLEVEMDQDGLMRYGVYSDSEITKGFCSCLIWVLDGAEPAEVLCVRAEDLLELNVGLPSRKSRVNSWHNVLISMQKSTRDLVKACSGGAIFYGGIECRSAPAFQISQCWGI
ncbi:sufE-like protein 2, chloroplastic [Dorcoceras hygrometricum]|uniref:SufE-like protein 2, chloroplastic n=1 Tax=Dorcoceras hygrometricum TaxID=472368 RepID=A0A2Z7BCE2_9LAMI|nr:sufE-like protein 2, chloroplastic [Dorcoceras hygrometricum]